MVTIYVVGVTSIPYPGVIINIVSKKDNSYRVTIRSSHIAHPGLHGNVLSRFMKEREMGELQAPKLRV
jgi:hypothetical protein